MLVKIPYTIISPLYKGILTPNQSTIQWIDIQGVSMGKYGDPLLTPELDYHANIIVWVNNLTIFNCTDQAAMIELFSSHVG